MPTAIARITRREPRHPRPRPGAPAVDDVVRAAATLQTLQERAQSGEGLREVQEAAQVLIAYVRGSREAGRALLRREALDYFDRLGASPGELEVLGTTAREAATARRFGIGARSLRRWRRGC